MCSCNSEVLRSRSEIKHLISVYFYQAIISVEMPGSKHRSRQIQSLTLYELEIFEGGGEGGMSFVKIPESISPKDDILPLHFIHSPAHKLGRQRALSFALCK